MASDWLDIKKDLCNYLQVIDSGKFATSGPAANANNPGLWVEGVGKVGLPLSERDAAGVIGVCHEAPLGKRGQGKPDSNVWHASQTWELEPSQFKLRNPAWSSTLNQIVGKVAQDLGVIDGAASIRPELHRLLLYEPGAFCDAYRE